MAKRNFKVVNQPVPKLDALALVLGKPMFAADFKPQDCLYAKFLWSPHAHALIRSIDISAAEKMPGVHCVLYHGNVPRIVHTTAGQGYPEPSPYDTFMFDRKVRYVGDRVAAVAAETPEIAEEAVAAIKVDYEVLEPVLSIDDALKEGAPVIHDEPEAHAMIPVPYEPRKNIAAKVAFDLGDIEKAMAEGEVTVDNTYYIHQAQHCPIEPHVALAYVDSDGRLVIRTSTQVPFHSRRIVAQVLGIPVRVVRVIKPRIGGGFGAKQEVLIDDVVGMLAWRTKRPVFLWYSREEEFVSSRTRHPERMRVRLAATRDGKLKGLGLDCIPNTGAYGSHALTVVCNSGSKIVVYSSDTDVTPFDVGAYASSTTYLSGNAVLNAAEKVRKQIFAVAAEMLNKKPNELELDFEKVRAKDGSGEVSFAEIALHSFYATNQFQIASVSSNISHKSPLPFAAHFAEVEVDVEAGLVRVIKYVAATDCGTPIHPKLAEGQVEGAVLNGITCALTEQYLYNDKGRMLNDSFLHYKIYSLRDKPEIITIMVPTYEKTGPFGAKSVSEIGINGPCPAIANAIYNAVGIRLRETPFTPEKVWRAIREKHPEYAAQNV